MSVTGKTKPAVKKKKTSSDRSQQVQSLHRAMIILEKLSEHDGGLSLTNLAKLSELPTSTTHRLLTTLENRRFVRFNRNFNMWSVGVQSFVVGNAFARSRNFVPMAKVFMRHLMDDAGETVNLATQDHEEIVYLAQVECKEMMRAFVRPGMRAPMYCSAVGKAIMAAMPKAERKRMLALGGVGPNGNKQTVYTPEFLSSLDTVRECGYALDDEEQSIGMRCVASVIYDENGEPLAAVSISGPTARITDKRIPSLGKLVKQTCRDITLNLGGHPSEEAIIS